jgi:hypothetical protein
LTKDDLKTILMETGGNMLACDERSTIITAKPIGAGVYRESNPDASLSRA